MIGPSRFLGAAPARARRAFVGCRPSLGTGATRSRTSGNKDATLSRSVQRRRTHCLRAIKNGRAQGWGGEHTGGARASQAQGTDRAFLEERVGSPHPARPSTLGTGTGLGKPSRDWRASPGEKGRAAREWVSAGHGCIGRCPSSLLAGSVWLAAGSREQARRSPHLDLNHG